MLRPIPTRYAGCVFRSRLEARWAVHFDALGLAWEYEPQGYILRDGLLYLPDFYLPQVKMFAEVKPSDELDRLEMTNDARLKVLWLAKESRRPVIVCDGPPRNTNYWAAWPEDGEEWPTWEDVHFCHALGYHLREGRLFASTGAHPFDHFPPEREPWSEWYDEHPAVVAARSARFGEREAAA